jgi:hypothetical protein
VVFDEKFFFHLTVENDVSGRKVFLLDNTRVVASQKTSEGFKK